MQYPKGLKHLNIYKDYLDMAKELSYNYKSKKDLFPRNLIDSGLDNSSFVGLLPYIRHALRLIYQCPRWLHTLVWSYKDLSMRTKAQIPGSLPYLAKARYNY